MKKANVIAPIIGCLALTIALGCSVKTVRFDKDKIYCVGACNTSELQLNSDSSFYLVNTICDIAAYDVSFGEYSFNNDTIVFFKDIEYYFSRNSEIKECECEEKKVTFKLKEHYPIHYGSSLVIYYTDVIIMGESSEGKIDTIPRGMIAWGRGDDLAKISISEDKLRDVS